MKRGIQSVKVGLKIKQNRCFLCVSCTECTQLFALHSTLYHLVVEWATRVCRAEGGIEPLSCQTPTDLKSAHHTSDAHPRTQTILDGTRTRNLRLRRPTPCPLGHEDMLTQAGCEPATMWTAPYAIMLRVKNANVAKAIEIKQVEFATCSFEIIFSNRDVVGWNSRSCRHTLYLLSYWVMLWAVMWVRLLRWLLHVYTASVMPTLVAGMEMMCRVIDTKLWCLCMRCVRSACRLVQPSTTINECPHDRHASLPSPERSCLPGILRSDSSNWQSACL